MFLGKQYDVIYRASVWIPQKHVLYSNYKCINTRCVTRIQIVLAIHKIQAGK